MAFTPLIDQLDGADLGEVGPRAAADGEAGERDELAAAAAQRTIGGVGDGNAGPGPVARIAVDLEHDVTAVVVGGRVELDARAGALRRDVDPPRPVGFSTAGLLLLPSQLTQKMPLEAALAAKSSRPGQSEFAQRHAAAGRGELHVQVAMAADGVRGRLRTTFRSCRHAANR